MSLQCLYCRVFKDESEFSGEHVIPQAIGGVFESGNPFKLHNVCERCNNVAGLYVDAPFLRSFSVHNGRAGSELRTVKLGLRTALPLTFLGRHCSLKHGTRVCELWLGPTGDLIYHFHEPYPKKPDWPIAVGPPPGRRKLTNIDHGFVFFFLRSNNPTWLPAILLSLWNQFSKSKVFLGNNVPAISSLFPPIPDELGSLYQRVKKSCLSGKAKTTFDVYLHAEERFMAKLALGMGALFLHPAFQNSPSADLLRGYLREANRKTARAQLGVEQMLFSMIDLELSSFLKWPGGHFLLLYPSTDQLLLYARFYNMQHTIVTMSSEPEHWAGRIAETGLLYVISPALRKYVGPKTLSEFIGHRLLDVPFIDPQFQALEKEGEAVTLPPFMI